MMTAVTSARAGMNAWASAKGKPPGIMRSMNLSLDVVCFPCLTGRCGHGDHVVATPAGGIERAVTYSGGSALCEDCAIREAEYLPEPRKP